MRKRCPLKAAECAALDRRCHFDLELCCYALIFVFYMRYLLVVMMASMACHRNRAETVEHGFSEDFTMQNRQARKNRLDL